MPYCKRIVILSSTEKRSDLKGLLSLEQNGVALKGTLKTYKSDDLKNLVIGIKVAGNLLSPINVPNDKVESFSFELNNSLDLTNDVSALVCTQNEEDFNPVLYGGNDPEEKVILAFKKEVVGFGRVGVVPKQTKTVEENSLNKKLNEVANASLFDYSNEDVEKLIDNELETVLQDETSIGYNENNFDENQDVNAFQLNNYNKSVTSVNDEEPPIFYNLVEDQVAKMFETYPEDKELSELISNSRFAKVDFDGDGLYYSLGLIYDDGGLVKNICYAVKAKKNQAPPEDIKEYCFFFPVDEENGYYMLMQDAKTGENIVSSDFLV